MTNDAIKNHLLNTFRKYGFRPNHDQLERAITRYQCFGHRLLTVYMPNLDRCYLRPDIWIFHLLSQADEMNLVRLNKNEAIAKELNSTIRSVTRSVIKLQNCNFIKKTNYKGGRIFMINPDYFYIGKSHHTLSSIYEQL